MNKISRRRFVSLSGCAMLALAAGAAGASGAFAQGRAAEPKPRIGIIGAGTVGSTLGKLFVSAGYPVVFSSRHPEELKSMAQGLGSLASVGTVQEAASAGEILLMAVPYGALPGVGQQLAGALRGKVVIDATNAFEGRDGELAKRVAAEGIGAVSASLLPGARIVRAFNTMSTHTIAQQAGRQGARLAIPIAGDDAEALRLATRLIDDIGLEAVVVGGLDKARIFQAGAPGWQAIGTADELRRRLQLPAK